MMHSSTSTSSTSRRFLATPPHEDFALIPSNLRLVLAEADLYRERNREHRLASVLSAIDPERFDVVLVDCPPALGVLTDNALLAGKRAIVPVQAETTSLRALELLWGQISSIEQAFGIHIEVVSVVPNLVQDSLMAEQTLAVLERTVPVLAPIVIKKRVVLQRAWAAGRSIFSYQPTNHNEEQAREELMVAFQALANHVFCRLEEVATHE